jgi:pimeloyl-ACP methyl ester carboxylesterase
LKIARVLIAAGLAAFALAAGQWGAARVNGTSLYYEIEGTGHPLVLLQGGQLDSRMWNEQFHNYARKYRVIRYDVRGFGRSGPTGAPYAHHDDLYALLQFLQVPKAYLVGLSLGGRIAVDFALTHPEMVDALVLVGPGLSGFAWSQSENAWAAPLQAAVKAKDSRRAVEEWLKCPYMAPAMENRKLAPWLRELALGNSRVWLQPDTESVLAPPAVGRLAEVRAPTLLILGTRDVPDIRRIVDKLAAGIRGARKETVEGAGHMVNLERQVEFNRTVLGFLGEQDRAATRSAAP